jgi:hypothetical protein
MGKAHLRSIAGRDSWSRSSGTRLALRACVVVVAALATLSTGTTVAVVQRAAAASCSTCGQNLILNPSAETGPGTSSDSVVKVPDWKQTGGFTAAEYSWSGGDISATSPGPSARGKNYFYGGPAATSTGMQLITLAPGAASSGKLVYVLSGWLGGYSDQGDDATLYSSFEGPNGKAISKSQIGPVTAAQRNGTELLFRHVSGPVPATTQAVLVQLVMQRFSGSDNDGMADNLSLVLSTSAAKGTSSTTTTGGPVQLSPQTVIVPATTVAATLRSVSADGSTYTFSARTGPLAKLKAGSVMFLAGIAVRLVTEVASLSSGFVVTTAPASLTDLVRNGTISWDSPVNFADASAVQGPGVQLESRFLPAGSGRPGSRGVDGAALLQAGSRTGSLGIGGKGVTLKGKAGSYSYSMSFKQVGRAASVSVTLSKSSPVEVSATASGTLQNFTTAGAIKVQDAKLGTGSVNMNGLRGEFTLSYELKPLTAFGLGAAGGFKLTIPAEITVPFVIPLPPPLPPIPMFLGLKVAFFVSVGFSNKNQSIKGSYTVNYDGQAGFSISKSGVTTGKSLIQGIGKVILDQANAILNGPITLVLGAQIPQIELGLGGKGLNVAGFVDLVADTAIKVGGQGPAGVGPSTGGCDARDLKVLATAGAEAAFFGLSADLGSTTLFSKDFIASWPPGCGTV